MRPRKSAFVVAQLPAAASLNNWGIPTLVPGSDVFVFDLDEVRNQARREKTARKEILN
jgi:hypothetical protein